MFIVADLVSLNTNTCMLPSFQRHIYIFNLKGGTLAVAQLDKDLLVSFKKCRAASKCLHSSMKEEWFYSKPECTLLLHKNLRRFTSE